MTLSNGQLERLAVQAVTHLANQPGEGILNPNIPVGDKGISYDGHITVHSNQTETKESFLGNVPVQVKGTLVESFTEDNVLSYSLAIDHYRNYLTTDGVILFVVEVKLNGETKIFYKTLLSLDLCKIIDNHGHQKSKTVHLRPLQETTLYAICRKFLSEKQYQPRMLVENMPLSFDAFETFTFSSLTFDLSNPKTSKIFEHDFVMYGVFNEALFPLDVVAISSIASSGVRRFYVNELSFDLMLEMKTEEHKTTLVLEQVCALIIDEREKRFTFRFLSFHSLSTQLKVAPFIIELFSGHPIEFSDCTIALNKDAEKLKSELQEMLQHQEELKEIASVFQQLGISDDTVFQEPDLHKFYKALKALTETIKQNKLIGINLKKPDNAQFINIELADKTLLVFYAPHGDTLLSNGFSSQMLNVECSVELQSNGGEFRHSVFTMLSVESLANAINLNVDTIKRSFDQFDPYHDDSTFDWTNNFCLKCLRAFDLSNNFQLLDLVSYIYSKYSPSDDAIGHNSTTTIIRINQLQIQKRIGEDLTQSQVRELVQQKQVAWSQNNQDLLFCINVLLNNKMEADVSFEQFDQENQEFYEGLPIFKLYNDL